MLFVWRGQYALTSFEPSWPKQDFVRQPHPRTSTGVHIWCFLVVWYGNTYALLCPCHVVLTLSLSLASFCFPCFHVPQWYRSYSISILVNWVNRWAHLPVNHDGERKTPLCLPPQARGTCMLPSPQLLWTNDWWLSFYGGLQLDYIFTRKNFTSSTHSILFPICVQVNSFTSKSNPISNFF